MGGSALDHDRDTGAPDRVTARDQGGSSAALQSALERLRLEGAVFLRAEYREPWAYESLTAGETAKILRPDSDRVILFHVVASGACWVAVDDGDKHWARRGDVIVLPYGDQHRMGGVQDAGLVSISTFLQMPPWRQMPVIRHGAGGDLTDVVCGYLHSRDPLFDSGLRVFPPVFVVRPPDGPAADWVRANVAYALKHTEAAPSSPGIVMSRLPELLLVEVLRLHLASAPAADRGWLAALNDPVLQPAMSLLHSAPERRWTVSSWRGKQPSHGPCSMPGSAKCSAGLRSGTSPSGGCTSQRTCWRRPISASASSPAGLATMPRKPSAAHSSAPTANRQAYGVPLTCCADAPTKLGFSVRHPGVPIMAPAVKQGDPELGADRRHSGR